eukprot:s683_g28.t1
MSIKPLQRCRAAEPEQCSNAVQHAAAGRFDGQRVVHRPNVSAMLKFAQFGTAEDEDQLLERTGLQGLGNTNCPKEALKSILEGEALEAKRRLKLLLAVDSSCARDRFWIRSFKALCWQNLAEAEEQLGQHKKALASLQHAVRDVEHRSADARMPLLRRLADCAMKAEDWPAATQALCRCLRLEPADTVSLRKLAQSLLRSGDMERCREVLTRLKHSEGVSEEEEWLLTRLKRRFQQPWYQCRGDSSKEADFASLNAARAKRRKTARHARAIPPKEQQLMRLSFVELMQTLRSMVLSSVPPFQPVVFVLRGTKEDNQQEGHDWKLFQWKAEESLQPLHLEETVHRTAMTGAVLDSLRSLMVEPWPLSGSAVQWLLHIIASEDASPATFEEMHEESRVVASFLALDENGNRSRCQSLRTWLFDVVRFTSERGRERLRVSVDKCKLTSLQVELLGGAVLLSQPLLRSAVETHSGVRAFWASSTFMAWIDQAGGEDPEPRLVLRSLVQEFGLYLGLRETEHARLRMWVEEGLGFDGSCQRGRLTAEEEEQLAAEVCAVDFWQRGGELTRALWAAASMRQGPATELALLRCRALFAAHGLKLQSSTGEELTTSRVQSRLQQVAAERFRAEPALGAAPQSGSAAASPDEEKLDVATKESHMQPEPESHIIGDDEEARRQGHSVHCAPLALASRTEAASPGHRDRLQLDRMMLLQNEKEAVELARSIAKSAALPSPLAMDQTKVKDLDRIFDCIGRLEAKSADFDILFLALEKIMSHF